MKKETPVVIHAKKAPSAQALALVKAPANAEALAKQGGALAPKVAALRVIGEDGLKEAAGYLHVLGECERGIQGLMKPIKQATDNAHKEAVKLEKGFLDPILGLKAQVKQKTDRYLTEQADIRRKAEEENRRAQEEYQAKLDRAKRPERVKEPEPVFIPPPAPIAGLAQVTRYYFEIENEFDVPDRFWSVDLDKLRAFVNENKEGAIGQVPGVRIWSEIKSQRG